MFDEQQVGVGHDEEIALRGQPLEIGEHLFHGVPVPSTAGRKFESSSQLVQQAALVPAAPSIDRADDESMWSGEHGFRPLAAIEDDQVHPWSPGRAKWVQ